MTDPLSPDPFAPEQLDAAWQRALQLVRDAGYDTDELLRLAADNIETWKLDPRSMLVPEALTPCPRCGQIDCDVVPDGYFERLAEEMAGMPALEEELEDNDWSEPIL